MSNSSVYSSIYTLTKLSELKSKELFKGEMTSEKSVIATLELEHENNKFSIILSTIQKIWSNQDKLFGLTS